MAGLRTQKRYVTHLNCIEELQDLAEEARPLFIPSLFNCGCGQRHEITKPWDKVINYKEEPWLLECAFADLTNRFNLVEYVVSMEQEIEQRPRRRTRTKKPAHT